MVSSRFLHCTGTVFPYSMNKWLQGRYFDTTQLSCFSSSFHSLLCYLLNSNFLFHHSFIFSFVRKSCSSSHLFIQLFIYISTNTNLSLYYVLIINIIIWFVRIVPDGGIENSFELATASSWHHHFSHLLALNVPGRYCTFPSPTQNQVFS